MMHMGLFNRSVVLMATRGQPEGLAAAAPHLVSIGMAKAADLHSKGLLKQVVSASVSV